MRDTTPPRARSSSRRILIALVLLATFASTLRLAPTPVQGASAGMVISQVYGGGGNSGALYRNDFIELFNRGSVAIDVTGWSVQYASASGATWQTTALSGSVAPGQYYLVQEAAGAGGTQNLPTPDSTGSIAMSATAAKVALVSSAAALSGACPSGASIIDLVGYGSASCSEGSPSATLNNTTAALRKNGGCTDTDNNSSDFDKVSPTPRNRSSSLNICAGVSTSPSGIGSSTPQAVNAGGTSLLTVSVTPGANPASTGIAVSGDLSSIGGQASQQFLDDGTQGDITAGDNNFSLQAVVSPATVNGAKTLPIVISDAQSRNGSATISITVGPTNPSGVGSASPSTVSPGGSSRLTVTVTPGSNPPSTGISVVGNLSSIGGAATQQFFDDGTNGDIAPGDNTFSYLATVTSNTTLGVKNLPVALSDVQSRSGSATVTLSVQAPSSCSSCGVERWSVKTGTDADAGLVDISSSTTTTITTMRGWPTQNNPPSNNRIAPYETTVWTVNATLTLYKKEGDSDYHLVLQDGPGNTIITEIPCPSCVGPASPFSAMIANARAQFDSRFTATTSFQTANVPVVMKGVGMFDFPHGQTGAASNQIELHPIIDIVFCSFAASPSSLVFGAGGGFGTINVSSATGCRWAVSNSLNWITITSGDSAGNDAVTFAVRENFTHAARQGSFTVSGQTVTVVQDGELGVDCLFSISPLFAAFSAGGGTATLNVSAASQCAWQALSNAPWVTITSNGNGLGNGAVSYSVAANPGSSARKAAIKVGGQVFSIKQKGQ